jgi:hypothetical protein
VKFCPLTKPKENMKTSIVRLITTVAVASALVSGSAYAFGIPGVSKGGSEKSASAVSSADFEKLMGETSSNVLSARIQFLRAQSDIAEAIGVKTDSFTKAAEALSAATGAATDSGKKVQAIEDSKKTTAAAQKEVDDAMTKSASLSDEAKAKFAEGTVKFVGAIVLEQKQIATITQLVDQGKSLASSASPMEKAKVLGLIKPASQMATTVPGDIKEGVTTFGQISKFATTNKISMPAEAKLPSKLGEL